MPVEDTILRGARLKIEYSYLLIKFSNKILVSFRTQQTLLSFAISSTQLKKFHRDPSIVITSAEILIQQIYFHKVIVYSCFGYWENYSKRINTIKIFRY